MKIMSIFPQANIRFNYEYALVALSCCMYMYGQCAAVIMIKMIILQPLLGEELGEETEARSGI